MSLLVCLIVCSFVCVRSCGLLLCLFVCLAGSDGRCVAWLFGYLVVCVVVCVWVVFCLVVRGAYVCGSLIGVCCFVSR